MNIRITPLKCGCARIPNYGYSYRAYLFILHLSTGSIIQPDYLLLKQPPIITFPAVSGLSFLSLSDNIQLEQFSSNPNYYIHTHNNYYSEENYK
ncbi:MAG: hypothetical protein N2V77_04560 [Canidatus Methanoxibalbensis ujae]|nr:hypothetical protein [Candidatus Methanoxibalbensis ujae]MCW7080559.1 hypothetical protein [Candidatus Methanospirare jalkutatii]